MVENARDTVAVAVADLMMRYSFELGEYRLEQWVQQWLALYPALWVRSAVIEALYQGRYKAISVSQLLDFWQRRGQPLQHFNREFERIVAGHSLPMWLGESATATREAASPEPVLIAAETPYPALIQNGRHDSASDSVIIMPRHPPKSWSETSTHPRATDPASSFNLPNLPEQKDEASTPIQPFQPAPTVELTLPGEIRRVAAQLPIQRFIPAADLSELHDKLRAIAQSLLLSRAQTMGKVIQTARSQPPALDAAPDRKSSDQPDQHQAAPADQPE